MIIEILWFLLLVVAFLVDCLLTVLTFTLYLWVVPDEKLVFGRVLKYYSKKVF